ncbi:MAG: DUF4153 domain-containing protein [Parvularculaceae bacterium]|jgi:hypothetical protein|nr:DUF4153 domain-containing protein [Parvularculaceae bacterium]
MSDAESRLGRAFALTGLLIGLATGFAGYAIIEYWAGSKPDAAALAALVALGSFSAALLLLAERGAVLRPILPSAAIAAILGGATYSVLVGRVNEPNYTEWPYAFWLLMGLPLSGYLMATLAKAMLRGKTPPDYSDVFFHGLTQPIISAGAGFIALLAVVLLFAWSGLLKALEVDFFHKLFQEPWFLLPFIGGVGGLAIALMRGLQATLGGFRFLLLLLARILMPITAAFSLTFLAVLALKGSEPIFAAPYPSAVMLGLAFGSMLIFNGVYQNGAGEPPAAWLRLSTILALLAFPVYAGLAAQAFWLRIEDYGLTPPRIIGLAMTGLAALYSVVALAGLVSEINWGGKRWMPPVAPLNTLMAVIWVVVLCGLASPLINQWDLSARSQERRLAEGKVSAAAFDYGYLRFRLGAHGEAALDRLFALDGHAEAATIQAGVARARAASDYWEYKNPLPAEPARAEVSQPPDDQAPPPGLDDLPINPQTDE